MPCEAQGPAAVRRRAGLTMHHVYFLRSLCRPAKTYVGLTEDVPARLAGHNAGGCPSTQRFRPWEIIAYLAVRDTDTAAELERYFKTGSGHAFWHKRFIRLPSIDGS